MKLVEEREGFGDFSACNPLLVDEENPATPSSGRQQDIPIQKSLTPTIDRISWLLPSPLAQRARQLELAPMQMAHEGHALLATHQQNFVSWQQWLSRWQRPTQIPGFLHRAVDVPFHDTSLLGALHRAQNVTGLSVLLPHLGAGTYTGSKLFVSRNMSRNDIFTAEALSLTSGLNGYPHGWGVAYLAGQTSGESGLKNIIWAGDFAQGRRLGAGQLMVYDRLATIVKMHLRGQWTSDGRIEGAKLTTPGGCWHGSMRDEVTPQTPSADKKYALFGASCPSPQLALTSGLMMRLRPNTSLTEEAVAVEVDLPDGRQLCAVVSQSNGGDSHGEGPLSPWWLLQLGNHTMTYASGEVFQGRLLDENLKRAVGTCTYADGSSYKGDWSDDKWHGFGKWIRADNWLLHGNFKNGAPHGNMWVGAPGQETRYINFIDGQAMPKDHLPDDLAPRQSNLQPQVFGDSISAQYIDKLARLQQEVSDLRNQVDDIKETMR